MKLHSGFAILDVKHGRKALAKKMPTGSNRLPDKERIPVTITGYISHQHGNDDGISIEFGVNGGGCIVLAYWFDVSGRSPVSGKC